MRSPPSSVSLPAALLATGLAFGALLVLAPVLAPLGDVGLALMQVAAFAAPVAVAAMSERAPLDRLGLSSAPKGMWIAAGAIGASFWIVNSTLIAPLGLAFFGGEDQLTRLGDRYFNGPLAVTLLIFALVPSLCEELLFRGLLVRSLLRRLAPPLAVVIPALLFAAIHTPVAKTVPALATGILLGYIALWSGSTLTAVLAHFLNNATTIIVAALVADGGFVISPLMIAPAIAITAVALRWMAVHRVVR